MSLPSPANHTSEYRLKLTATNLVFAGPTGFERSAHQIFVVFICMMALSSCSVFLPLYERPSNRVSSRQEKATAPSGSPADCPALNPRSDSFLRMMLLILYASAPGWP